MPLSDRQAESIEKNHGRLEKRTLRTTTSLTLQHLWPGLSQGFELRRERTIKGKTTVEVVYGITSLRPEKAGPARLLELLRDHWQIENCLHYVRDVTLREDACRVRKGTAPQVLAALRNAIHLLAGVVAPSRAAAIRRFNAHPDEALRILQDADAQ